MKATVGETIKSLRIASNETRQYVLASRAGISAQYLNDIELGRRIPPPVTIERLAEALNVEAVPLMWMWVRQQVGDEIADAMILDAQQADHEDDIRCEGHEYQRRGSWSGDDWCAVDGCTSRGPASTD